MAKLDRARIEPELMAHIDVLFDFFERVGHGLPEEDEAAFKLHSVTIITLVEAMLKIYGPRSEEVESFYSDLYRQLSEFATSINRRRTN